MAFDVEAVRAEFPILARQVNGKPLVYLDSAASAQKPRAVIDAMVHAMEHSYANVHRGLHTLASETTEAYEGARKKVAAFIGAEPAEIVFTKGGTEAINLVAAGLGAMETLENHTVDFRQGPLFAQWRAIVGPFFAVPPAVEHFELVAKSA